MNTRGKGWGDTKSQSFTESWDKKVDWFQFPHNEELRIRLIGPVYVVGRHWPNLLTKFVPGQKPKVFPMWCTKFNSVTEKLDPERVCSGCDDFDMYMETLAITNVIVRKFQEGRSRRENAAVPVIWRHSDVDKVFRKAFEKYRADPADPKKGCDFSVEYDPNSKKSRWTIQREDQAPLTEEELNYELTDFESLIPDYSDSELMSEHARDNHKSLARAGYYVMPLKNGEDGWEAYKTDLNGKPYTAYPDLVAFRDGNRVTGSSGSVGVSKFGSSSSDDDMPAPRRPRADADSDDAPVAKPVAKPVAAKPAPKPVVEVADEPSDEDDAPPPPPPRVQAKPVVKAPPAPVVEEEDEDSPVQASADDDDEEAAPPPKVVAKPAPKAEVAKPAAKAGGPAEAWTAKFGVTWVKKNGKEVPGCWGEYVGAKKCMTCPETNSCLEASES